MPLGQVSFFTGFKISSISDRVFSSFPIVASSTAAATFSLTWLSKRVSQNLINFNKHSRNVEQQLKKTATYNQI